MPPTAPFSWNAGKVPSARTGGLRSQRDRRWRGALRPPPARAGLGRPGRPRTAPGGRSSHRRTPGGSPGSRRRYQEADRDGRGETDQGACEVAASSPEARRTQEDHELDALAENRHGGEQHQAAAYRSREPRFDLLFHLVRRAARASHTMAVVSSAAPASMVTASNSCSARPSNPPANRSKANAPAALAAMPAPTPIQTYRRELPAGPLEVAEDDAYDQHGFQDSRKTRRNAVAITNERS